MNRGYIKLWRKFGETSFFKNSHCVHLAVHLLLECNHEPRKFLLNRKEEVCGRGQTITGLAKMSASTGISVRSLRTSLQVLSNIGFLTSKTTNKFRLISIVKYEDYQGETTSNLTSHRQATDKQTTTNKNDKHYKNNIESGRFAPPTLQEITAYCKERSNNVNPAKWLAHYEANGWKVGRNPMKDWKAAVRTWEANQFSTPGAPARSEAPEIREARENTRLLDKAGR